MTAKQSGALMEAQQEVTQNLDSGSASAQPVESVRSERTFTQGDVDHIVKKAKSDAVESFKKMQVERPEYLAQKHPDAYIPQNTSSMSEDNYRRIAAEEAQRLRDQWMNEARSNAEQERANRTVANLRQKLDAGKSKYDDFDKVTADINLGRFPNVVELLGDFVDNSADVLYHLGNDRIKLAQLEMIAERSPQDAIIAAKRLADSLKQNEEASQVKLPREPLSQMRPSNTGTDTGVLSVKDYRLKYRV